MKLNLQNPNLTQQEIREIVLEEREKESQTGIGMDGPEVRRMVTYWEENRPQMMKRLKTVAPDAPTALASRQWDRAFQQAKETTSNFPTFNEALEVAQRDNLMMEPETESDQSVQPGEVDLA